VKLDGIRASVQEGKLWSRSLKEIPNSYVQRMFRGMAPGFDGELIFGVPSEKGCFQRTTSVVMSDDKPCGGINYFVFDFFATLPFEKRLEAMHQRIKGHLGVIPVQQKLILNEDELLEFEQEAVGQGHEGVMVRSLDGPYKQGRSTVKEGWLLKLKRFEDSEAEIIGFYERMHNTNEAKTNALGRTERSSAKDGKVGLGVLGGFQVRDLKTGVEFEVGSGLDADQQKDFWARRPELLGGILKYKFFPVGIKDKPRHPIFLGLRDKRDIS
jgi:DNA ligase-1